MWGRNNQLVEESSQLVDRILAQEGIGGGVRLYVKRGLARDGTLGQTLTSCRIEVDAKLVSLAARDGHAKEVLETVVRHEIAHVIEHTELGHSTRWEEIAARLGIEAPNEVTPVSEELGLLLEG